MNADTGVRERARLAYGHLGSDDIVTMVQWVSDRYINDPVAKAILDAACDQIESGSE